MIYQWEDSSMERPSGSVSIDLWESYIWLFHYEDGFNYPMSRLQNAIGLSMNATQNPEYTGSALETGAAFSTAQNRDNLHISYQPHTWQETQFFMPWLMNRAMFVWNHLNYKGSPIITSSWTNLHKRTGATLEHNHNHTPLIATCYLQCPPNSGNIEFRDPLEYHKFGLPYEPLEYLWKEVKVKTNDVLFFPGWIKHRTQVSNSDDDRVVLTINFGA
jgi:hypothetical protein